MTIDSLVTVFKNALFIVHDTSLDNGGVFLGTVSIREPAGMDAMLKAYTSYIDGLLATLPLTPSQYLELLTARAFTFDEYQALWLPNIKPKDYHHYIIYRVLLITDEQDKLLFTSVRDNSHADFDSFLQVYTAHCNHLLHSLLYEIYD